MEYRLDLTGFRPVVPVPLGADFSGSSPEGDSFSFNSYYMEKNGTPFFAVSGEFHYSRMDDSRWEDELIKMRMGGVNIVSTYLFWNHMEETEGEFDFTGRRNLRRFVELCGRHGLYVILRIGPFDHGEVRNGGLPDWLYGKPFEVRHTNEGFMRYVRRLYAQIGEQVKGLFWKDGGPVIGVQLDNEYMHSSAPWEITTGVSNEWVFGGNEGEKYILALREIALECGLVPAFFTGTAWGGAAYSPRVLPLWGGYAYRPWIFYSHQGEHPATEEYIYEDYHHNGKAWADDFAPPYEPASRPYACCEMGGGMTCCYYYRFRYPCRSVDALANIKVGSGCNFIGYYMFQGGTNPVGKTGIFLNESQMPRISYDYQAALGEFGQIRESYSRLKSIHLFTRFFGALLAPMETVLPEGGSRISPEDLETLRFAVRTDGKSGFLFINNFQDHRDMPAKKDERICIQTGKDRFVFDISIGPEENAILPFNFEMDGILLKQANAQPVLRTKAGNRQLWVFMIPDGMDGSFRFEDGAKIQRDPADPAFFTVSKGAARTDVLVLSRENANRMFLLRDGSLIFTDAALLEDEQDGLRLETTQAGNRLICWPADRLENTCARPLENHGILGVYEVQTQAREIPVQVESAAPFRWLLRFPESFPEGLKDARLQIDYSGDIGMLFQDGRLIHDNFCNGDVWEIGLAEFRNRLAEPMVLKISPLRKDARVSVESAMAARNEEVRETVAELKGIRVQPVYEIRL